jgi:predicted alpha/beta hydrolase
MSSNQTVAMKPESITLNCTDGYPLSANLFRSEHAQSAVVIVPALGVPARFYALYARYLAGRGHAVLSFDYRGSGQSADGPVRGRDIRMSDWGKLDIDAALTWARQQLKPGKLFLVGHSAGAQLPGLAAASEGLDGMVMVAGSAPHLRHYPARSWPMLMLTWYVLAPLLSIGRDDFPARQTGLGSTRVAVGVVRQWAQWARSQDYLFDKKSGLDVTGYAKLRIPVLSYCFADDSYATPAAVDALLAHYSSARVVRHVVPKSAHGTIGHFGFFREKSEKSLWTESADWLDSVLHGSPGKT